MKIALDNPFVIGYSLVIMAKKLRKGSAVEVNPKYQVNGTLWPEHLYRGTVTQIGRTKARVLFPIRVFYWLPIDMLKIVGYDGDGSSVGWK